VSSTSAIHSQTRLVHIATSIALQSANMEPSILSPGPARVFEARSRATGAASGAPNVPLALLTGLLALARLSAAPQ
jgi:hypothetical protein